MISSCTMPRRPSRIRMSPARTGCPRACQDARRRSSQRRIVPAMARAMRRSGSSLGRGCVGQRPRLVLRGRARPGRASGHSSTSPGCVGALGGVAQAVVGLDHAALRLGQREHGVDQPPAPPGPSGTSGRAARRGSAVCAASARAGQLRPGPGGSWRGRHPGSCRSTASRRRPRTACAVAVARALRRRRTPRSACAMISHCRGLVSCASSTRTWSIRASSLNSTHSRRPGRCSSRTRALDQVVIVECRRARLQRLVGVDGRRSRPAAAPRCGARSAGRAGCRPAGPAAPARAPAPAAPARTPPSSSPASCSPPPSAVRKQRRYSASSRTRSSGAAASQAAMVVAALGILGRALRQGAGRRPAGLPRRASVGAGLRLQRGRLAARARRRVRGRCRPAWPRGRRWNAARPRSSRSRWPSSSASVSVSVALGQRHGQDLHGPAQRRAAIAGPARRTSSRASCISSRGAALVDGLEVRRHPGLERESAQQRAAQRVDGHHAQPARQLQHLREQAPRPVEPLRRRPARRSAPAAPPRASASSGAVAQAASRSSMRAVISAAAALVKVRQRMPSGSVPPSSSRSTRSDSTRVLPVPALAVTQTEDAGSAARRCAGVGARGSAQADRLRARPFADRGPDAHSR